MSILAQYQCQNCKLKWQKRPGPQTCPRCQHLYIDWLNVDDFKEDNEED